VKVRFWGVRGSIPVPGAETARYGGNSACVEVRIEGAAPLVLDAGTGARALGQALGAEGVRKVHLLFSHFHMDHVFGFPFFAPVYSPNTRVEVVVPAHSEIDGEQKLARYLNGLYHPVRLADVRDSLEFRPVRPDQDLAVGPYRVRTIGLSHPGGACGYRIDAGGRSMAYLSDTAPLARPGEGLLVGRRPPGLEQRALQLLRGVDLVVMDTMFERDEYLERMTWGHGYPEYAVGLCEAAGVGHLVLFHHAPDATDAVLDARAARWAAHAGLRVSLAIEGQALSA